MSEERGHTPANTQVCVVIRTVNEWRVIGRPNDVVPGRGRASDGEREISAIKSVRRRVRSTCGDCHSPSGSIFNDTSRGVCLGEPNDAHGRGRASESDVDLLGDAKHGGDGENENEEERKEGGGRHRRGKLAQMRSAPPIAV